jgi:hypothetical protein
MHGNRVPREAGRARTVSLPQDNMIGRADRTDGEGKHSLQSVVFHGWLVVWGCLISLALNHSITLVHGALAPPPSLSLLSAIQTLSQAEPTAVAQDVEVSSSATTLRASPRRRPTSPSSSARSA